MNCLGADVLTTIANALDWDVEHGLRHLNTCNICGDQLRALQVTHDAFAESVAVSDDVVAKITHLISAEADHEQARERRRHKLGNIVEALLAGLTGVMVASGGGVGMSGSATALVFAAVATTVFGYRAFASSHASASRNSAASIQ
jgi:hypothetical protein